VTSHRALVVEDDVLTAESIAFALRDEGFEVDLAHDGETAVEWARARPPDVAVLDLRLPGELSGMEVCALLRRESPLPILVVTARHSETDVVLALERGADDYVTKPFSLPELVARVRALLRGRALARAGPPDVCEAGGIRIDLAEQQVEVDGSPVHATPSELRLLTLLAERAGRPVSRRELCVRLWGSDRSFDTRACDLHIARLRHKLEADPSRPRLLVTVRGVGYKLVAPHGPPE
jgi:DNA-binding response OmpR family regulator